MFANTGTAKYASFGEITEELYDSIFNIDVMDLFFTVKKALQLPDDVILAMPKNTVSSVYKYSIQPIYLLKRQWQSKVVGQYILMFPHIQILSSHSRAFKREQ